MGWFQRLGLQKRIMLYVAIGLVVMFGALIYLGMQAIAQATELVYEERLVIARMTAGILERDFDHVTRDVADYAPELAAALPDARGQAVVQGLLHHLSDTDRFPFFQVNGVWLVDTQGAPILTASTGPLSVVDAEARPTRIPDPVLQGKLQVVPAMVKRGDGMEFASIVVPLADASGDVRRVVAVHSASLNSQSPYLPLGAAAAGPGGTSPHGAATGVQAKYNLEVVEPGGDIILGIGEDERPGERSHHFEIIEALASSGQERILLHNPRGIGDLGPHVMAVVRLANTPFYMVLEQAQDVALALPIQLRQQFLAFAAFGFLAALLLAWVTTRHVVQPTERLTVAAQRMAQGELATPITIRAQDEIGSLSESLETMRRQLKAAIEQVEQANTALESRVRERTARLSEVLGKVISAQEEERHRLARELHDETAQALGALCIALDRIRDTMSDATPAETVQEVLRAKTVATRLLDETRRLILDLRPTALDDFGLIPAIRWYVESHLEERGLRVTLVAPPAAVRLPGPTEVALFRIVQEAINNIAKHARARNATISIEISDSTARISITDDGVGFDLGRVVSERSAEQHVGLVGMRERIVLLGGRMEIDSAPGRGTRIHVEAPVG